MMSLSAGQESYIDSTRIKDPSLAWKLSLIPGGGQIYNGKWGKAAALILAQYVAVSNFNDLRKQGNIEKRNKYGWWIMGLYVFGILDAYVDAQLSTFPTKITETEEYPLKEESEPPEGDAE